MNLMKLKGHSSMLGANVMWGLMSPVAKFVMVGGAVTPLVVTDLRITGAMVLFWIASFFQKPERVAPKDLLKLLGASLLAIVFNQGCFIFGVGLTSPVDASIITTSMFKYFVNKYSLITIMKWMFTYAFICALPFSYNDLLHTEWKSLQNTEIGALVFIVVGSTFVSYVLIVIGQKNLRPTVAGMYNYVQPLVASIVAVCWGMDTFNFVKIISVALIFGGVYLVTNSRSKAEMEAVVADKN